MDRIIREVTETQLRSTSVKIEDGFYASMEWKTIIYTPKENKETSWKEEVSHNHLSGLYF
jgi:hypothetical protein